MAKRGADKTRGQSKQLPEYIIWCESLRASKAIRAVILHSKAKVIKHQLQNKISDSVNEQKKKWRIDLLLVSQIKVTC